MPYILPAILALVIVVLLVLLLKKPKVVVKEASDASVEPLRICPRNQSKVYLVEVIRMRFLLHCLMSCGPR